MYDVIVIGGGAAGMMAAGRAAERGKRVLLLEKNKRLGEKLCISGGGRCNITNAQDDERKLLSQYGASEPFLYSAFSQFGMRDTFSFFEGLGLPLKVEANNRAFPVSEKAPDVVAALERYMAAGTVEVRTGVKTANIIAAGGRITKVQAGGIEYEAASIILATGGVSHPETGSTGDGFAWLTRLNEPVQTPTPTIVPLKVREKWVRQVSGISIKDMKITFFVEGKKKFSKSGAVLFTHFGISGPLILNSAGKVADLLHEGTVTARIDTHPATDLGILDDELTALFDANKNKMLKNIFTKIAPLGMSDALLLQLPNINPDTKVHSVTKEERRELVELLKGIPLTVTGLMGLDRAVVADGGLPLSQVDMRTMRSHTFENLYIVGDLLHITRPSGGYSLQLCWTTGYVAGSNA